MKKVFQTATFSFCLCLLGATGWILSKPIPVYAATCIADCRDGRLVTCKGKAGTTCIASDGAYGFCQVEDSSGAILLYKSCRNFSQPPGGIN